MDYENLYFGIVAGIHEDSQKKYNAPLYFEILEETKDHIAVLDGLDGFDREYTIHRPASMGRDFLESRVIVTDSAKELPYGIGIKKLADFLIQNLDKEVYMNLNHMIFVADAERDAKLPKTSLKKICSASFGVPAAACW